MTEFFAQPDDVGEIRASELHGSMLERIEAQGGEAFMSGTRTLGRLFQYSGAEGIAAMTSDAATDPAVQEQLEQQRRDLPSLSIADAQTRIKDEGLEHHVKLPQQPDIKQGVLDLMIAHGHERRQYEAAVSRAPGLVPDALGFVTEMGLGIIDPVNMAAFSVPVIGEARYGHMLASAGDSLAARAGVKALVGAGQGAVGSAAIAPADWWLHSRDGQDYTMADALRSVVLGAGMGAGFHAGIGAFRDMRARAAGAPLAGSPADLVERGLGGTHVQGRALAEAGVPAEDVPGIGAGGESVLPAPRPGEGGEGTVPERSVPAGHVRLYRGESPHNEQNGGYYTTDRNMAEGFGALRFVDLPEDAAKFFKMPGMGEIYNLTDYRAGPGDINWRSRSGPLHPAEILADLPPRVRENVTQAAIADVLADRPVRAGEMLAIAADQDPRIAESLRGELASADVVPGPPAAMGPRARDESTFSLHEFLAHKGGLAPHPDIATIFGGKNKFVPGFGNLIRRTGMSPDRAREAAVEAGYLHDPAQQHGGVTESTVNHLLEAIDAEARGNRQYRAGSERAAGRDREQYRAEIERELDGALVDVGLKASDVTGKLRARVVELIEREGISDPLVAHERAVMEETQRVADSKATERIPDHIPGWDVPDDAGAAPGAGRAARPELVAGREGPRPAASAARPGDRGADAWRKLAEQRDPDAANDLAESRAAAETPELASADAVKAPSAAEKAAAEADKLLEDIKSKLTEAERARFDEVLAALSQDKEARDQVVRDGAACLLEAAG